MPKALRNILEIDIYYNSENVILRKKALLGKIAKRLGEDRKSPLNGRVIIGEDAQTEKCCITLEYIKAALDKTSFFNKYRNNGSVISHGIFDQNDNNATMDVFYPILLGYLTRIQDNCPTDWNSYITKNNCIVAVIRILDDIVNIVLTQDPSLIKNTENLLAACDDYITALSVTLAELPSEKRGDIIRLRGERAKEDAYRTVQMATHEQYPAFTNDNIETYFKEKYTNYAVKAQASVKRVIEYLRDITRFAFDEPGWKAKHMSNDHQDDFSSRIVKMQNAKERNGDYTSIDEWGELTLHDIIKIIGFSTHWSDVYKSQISTLGMNTTKAEFVALLTSINAIYEKITLGKSVTLSEYNQVCTISNLLAKEEEDGSGIEVGWREEAVVV